MSTTLSVLHVLMAGPGRDVDLPAGARDVILGGGAGGVGGLGALDPVLRDFWSGFPCPPPWNHALLFRVNWTACVGQAVGERLKWFLADRCNIPHDGEGLLPGGAGGGEGGEEEMEAPEACAVPCIIMVSLACLVFSLLIAGVVFCVCRKRPKNSSPTHQSSLSAHPDNAKYYTSCHYASAPVMPRPLETTLCGSGTETRLMNGGSGGSHQMSPYHQQLEHQPLVTPKHLPHALCGHAPLARHHVLGHAHHHGHAHLAPLLVNVSGQGGDQPSTPSRSLLGYYRLDSGVGGSGGSSCGRVGGGGGGGGMQGGGGEYTSSSAASQSNGSDRSHTYESIGDCPFAESVRIGKLGGSLGQGGERGGDRGGGGLAGMGFPLADGRLLGVMDSDFCDCECSSAAVVPAALAGHGHSGLLGGAGVGLGPGGGGGPSSASPHLFDSASQPQPGNENSAGGYYDDRNAQTLPVRHFRHILRERELESSPFEGPFCFDIDDGGGAGGKASAVSPASAAGRSDSRLSNRSRRRTSSGSHYSDRSFGGVSSSGGGYREGGKRSIPALHANYFDPPEPPAPDTFKS